MLCKHLSLTVLHLVLTSRFAVGVNFCGVILKIVMILTSLAVVAFVLSSLHQATCDSEEKSYWHSPTNIQFLL
jgi:hypothetical protein